MEGGLLSLRWNDHGSTFFEMLSSIREKETYCDVTLVCEGRFYPVHKLVLSTCSDFFDSLFSKTDCKHPIIIVANVMPKDLEALLNYMYLGEVNVLQTELSNLMKAAEVLRIKGLAEPSKGADKDTKDRKRTSGGESAIDSPVKRKRAVDNEVQPTRRSSPQILEKTNGNNSLRHETSDDAQTFKRSSDLSALPCSSSMSIENKLEQLLTPRVPTPTESNPKGLVSESEHNKAEKKEDKTPKSDVKVEEIVIKDEGDGWFEETDEGLDALTLNETESSMGYNSQAVAAAAAAAYTGLPWELASSSQPLPMEGHIPQGMPGSSGMHRMMEFGLLSSFTKRARYRNYEATRRTRNFVENWRMEFPWVHYDAEKRVMTCKTCIKYGLEEERSRFISGNTNFKRLALVRHEVSMVHQRCEARKEADLATICPPSAVNEPFCQ